MPNKTPLTVPAPLREAPIDTSTSRFSQPWSDWFNRADKVLLAASRSVSALTYGADPSGSSDSSPAINAAVSAVVSAGVGGQVYIPAGVYKISQPIIFPASLPPTSFFGDGEGTLFLRGADMPANQGMFDIQGCSGLEFEQISVDGQVLTPSGITYSAVGGNPMLSDLTANTSFWIHGGSQRIRFRDVAVRHTGGYAILIQCSEGLIQDVRILDSIFENNRPHLFGTSSSDLMYGSWNGGIYVDGDGRFPVDHKVLRGFIVRNCGFRRNTGNCLWSHLYGLNELHTDFQFSENRFLDCGLDGILVGGVSGGAVNDNVFRRVGYVTLNDNDASSPKWLPGLNATALDSSGIVKGVSYRGNSFCSINGGSMDLDGHGHSAITGNIFRQPQPSEPEYAEDLIAQTGPPGVGPAAYGVNVNNSNDVEDGANNIEFSGNQFIKLPGGALRLYAARNCQAIGNNIDTPDQPQAPPILLGNTGNGDNRRAHDNVITGNRIRYNPPSAAPCVYEDAGGFPFLGSDVNRVFGNTLWPSGTPAAEFQKDPNSGSLNS